MSKSLTASRLHDKSTAQVYFLGLANHWFARCNAFGPQKLPVTLAYLTNYAAAKHHERAMRVGSTTQVPAKATLTYCTISLCRDIDEHTWEASLNCLAGSQAVGLLRACCHSSNCALADDRCRPLAFPRRQKSASATSRMQHPSGEHAN